MNVSDKLHSVVGTDTYIHLLLERNKFLSGEETQSSFMSIKREIESSMPVCYIDENGNCLDNEELMIEVEINPDFKCSMRNTLELFLDSKLTYSKPK